MNKKIEYALYALIVIIAMGFIAALFILIGPAPIPAPLTVITQIAVTRIVEYNPTIIVTVVCCDTCQSDIIPAPYATPTVTIPAPIIPTNTPTIPAPIIPTPTNKPIVRIDPTNIPNNRIDPTITPITPTPAPSNTPIIPTVTSQPTIESTPTIPAPIPTNKPESKEEYCRSIPIEKYNSLDYCTQFNRLP